MLYRPLLQPLPLPLCLKPLANPLLRVCASTEVLWAVHWRRQSLSKWHQ